MEQQSQFKTQTFDSLGQEYLYELHVKGNNSMLRVYDSRAKLRLTQRLKLPANYQVYTCQQFLILLNDKEILLYEFPNSTLLRKSLNLGIKRILHCCYNLSANLILLINEVNELWYLMPEQRGFKVKKLMRLSDNGIKGRITQLILDNESIVHILCSDTKVLHSLQFSWNENDKLIAQNSRNKVVAYYSRFQWKAVISVVDDDEDNYKIQMNDGNDQFQNNIPIFQADRCLLIKITRQDFIYLDAQEKQLIIISKGQHNRINGIKHFFPQRAAPNNFLFQTKTNSYDTIKLCLHFFEGVNEKQPFNTIQIPIQKQQQDDSVQRYIYIYNNIHLIFEETGISPHFLEKVKKYIQKETNEGESEGEQKIACMFLQKLFKDAPLTIAKLVEYLTKEQHNNNFKAKLVRFLPYIYYTLNQVTHNLRNVYINEQLDNDSEYQSQEEVLKNVVSFVGKVTFSLHANKIEQVMRSNQMQEEDQQESLKYSLCLDRVKTLYLLNQIIYENNCKNKMTKNENNSSESQIMRKSKQNINQHKIHEHKLKIGKETCHQFFESSLKADMKCEEVIEYLLNCSDFMQAAYFYIYMDNTKTSIPYINDPETVQLIKFLVLNPTPQVLSNREVFKKVIKRLPQETTKSLLINQPEYLQYICSLSINCQQIRCCLAVLLSGVTRTWACKQFVVHAFVLCNRALEAYNLLASFAESYQERGELFESFVNLCISSKKLKDLFHLNLSQSQQKCVLQKLTTVFKGEDGDEIAQLMRELRSQNEQ